MNSNKRRKIISLSFLNGSLGSSEVEYKVIGPDLGYR